MTDRTELAARLRRYAADPEYWVQDDDVLRNLTKGLREAADALDAPDPRVAAVIEAADFLLVWTYQADAVQDPTDGKWKIEDLHPGGWNKMNSAEQDLYHKLKILRGADG